MLEHRAPREGFLHQLVHWLLFFWELFQAYAIGRNHLRCHQRWIVEVSRDGFFDDLLLIFQSVLRTDQGLLVCCNGLVGVQDVERGHRADFQLPAIFDCHLAALLERALLGLHVLIRVHQTPVNVLYLVDGVKNLLAKSGVGDAAIVDRLIVVALVYPDAGSQQQVLGELGSSGWN